MQTDNHSQRWSIFVIISNLNQPDYLCSCLASLAAGDRTPDQVIVLGVQSRQCAANILPHHLVQQGLPLIQDCRFRVDRHAGGPVLPEALQHD